MERNRGNVHVFMPSRRRFLQNSLALGAIAVPERPTSATLETRATDGISLDGEWMFRTDPQDTGEKLNWQTSTEPLTDWRTVTVPHTWQIERPLTEYRGVAWYRREFDTPRVAPDSAIRIEFEAVFYSARIWINGKPAGEHLRKAYTAFTCDTGRLLLEARPNTLVVRVHNSFNEQMLPRGRDAVFRERKARAHDWWRKAAAAAEEILDMTYYSAVAMRQLGEEGRVHGIAEEATVSRA